MTEVPTPADLARDPLPLQGRVALVTGVSRRDGIGFAIARRLAAYGASVVVHHFRPHDAAHPWGADDLQAVLDGVRAAQRGEGAALVDVDADLADPLAPERVMRAAVDAFAHVDVLVCNHARGGGDGALGELDAAMLDGHYAVNTRSSILLAQAFAAQHDGRAGGRIVFMTSGQGLGPLPGEVAYAAAKGALAARDAHDRRSARRPRGDGQHGQPRPGRHGLLHRRPATPAGAHAALRPPGRARTTRRG